jgi:hypothetical protein
MFPKAMTGWPSFITNAGMIVWNGRLRGETTFGDDASSVKQRAAVVQQEAVAGDRDAGPEHVATS